jgi:two-component system, OmpR family, alkaline phosphatase synthesis response regulator PhoP
MAIRILVVDDEADIVRMLKYNLEKEGYEVVTAGNGKAALEKAHTRPDLIVLDVMMPQMDGWEVIRQLKRTQDTASIPVLFLTAKGTEIDEVLGLELGADDYIVKPISPRKLLARIKTALRKKDASAGSEQETILHIQNILINLPNYSVKIDKEEVFLPKKEFEVLAYLAQHRGRVVTRESLLDRIWGQGVIVVDRTIDVHVRKIREKLGKYADLIETVKGVGYRFKDDE